MKGYTAGTQSPSRMRGSYQDLIEMRSGQQTSQQRIDAKRLGGCPRDAGAPRSPAPK